MKLKFAVALIATLTPSAVSAQNIFTEMLKAGTRSLDRDTRRQERQARERIELLTRISTDIRLRPEAACQRPQGPIRAWLGTEVNKDGLMDNISQTVFRRGSETAPKLDGYQRLLQQTREETARLQARNRAISDAMATGGETPVGNSSAPVAPSYNVSLTNIKAVSRIENGLQCSLDASVDFLRFPVTFTVVLAPNDPDGWISTPQAPAFTDTQALAPDSPIRIRYNGDDLTLAQAREQTRVNIVNETAAARQAAQQAAAKTAYQNSPAGRLEALRERRAMMAKQQACEANGGTWGVNASNVILRVDAATATGLYAATQGCFFMGR